MQALGGASHTPFFGDGAENTQGSEIHDVLFKR